MGGDDLREERLRRFQIVVVPVNATLGEAPGLFFGDDAGTDGNVETGLVFHDRDEFEDALHGPLIGAADGEHDAELAGTERCGFARCGDDIGGVEERHGLHR